MEESLIKGSHLGEWKEGSLSLPSSPTPLKAVCPPSSVIFPTSEEAVAETGNVCSVEGLELQETTRQFLAASEREDSEELCVTAVNIDTQFRESSCASNNAEFAPYVKRAEPHVATSACGPDDETEPPLEGNITELAHYVNGLEPHVASIPCGPDEKENLLGANIAEFAPYVKSQEAHAATSSCRPDNETEPPLEGNITELALYVNGLEPHVASIPCGPDEKENLLGAHMAEFAPYVKSLEPHVASSACRPDDETEPPLKGNITELATYVNGLEPHVASIPRGPDEKENLLGANIAEFAPYVKSPEPHVTSIACELDDETKHPLEGNISELAPYVNGREPHVASIPCGPDEKEHPFIQEEINTSCHSAQLEQTSQLDNTNGLEALAHTQQSSEGANHVAQPAGMEQKISRSTSPKSNIIDGAEHIEDAESQKIAKCIPQGVNDNEEHAALLPGVSSDVTATKEMEDTKHTFDDIEHVSQVNNVDCQESHSYVSTPPNRTDVDAKHRSLRVEETTMQVSLHEHLQQDRAGTEDASMRNFIMHRFLPAAQEVAAMEHDSSLASLANRKQAAVVCPSPQKPQRPPIAHRIKARAHQASKGLATRCPLNATPPQEDSVSHSMKSCGFFCLGLKSALLQAQRTVSASTRAASRKKSWTSHLSSHAKVVDEGCPCIKGDVETVECSSRHPSASHMYFAPSFHETPRRRRMKHRANFFKDHSTRIGYISARCNLPLSQSEKLDVSGNTYKQMVSTVSPPCQSEKLDVSTDNSPFELVGTVSKKKEETVIQGVAAEAFISPCNCEHADALDLNNAYMATSPLQIRKGGRQAHSFPAQEEARQDGDADDDDGDMESQFFDALSRLNSVKSTASFYTFGSPRSLCENLGSQNECTAKYETEYMDALSPFETPRASMSEENSVSVQLEHGIHINREPLSLSQRLGKALKLETCDHLSGPSNRDCPTCTHAHFEDKHMPREGDLRIESFSRTRHRSLDSVCLQNAGTVSPIFPAKCQSSSSSLGWPFGISTYHSSRTERSMDQVYPEKNVDKYVPGLNVLSPPLPPSPKGSWLDKAITRNASKSSPLATLQQKDKVTSARRKLDFLVTNANSERRWEDVVKGSQIQTGHLRFSEELHQNHPLNHNDIQPLKL